MVYMVVIYISEKFNNKKLLVCVSVFICMAGATVVSIYNLRFPLGLHSFFAAFIVFQAGVFLHNTCPGRKISGHKYKVITVSFIALCLLSRYGKIDMASGNITNIVFFLAASFAGWFLLYSIASCKGIRENKFLIYTGQHTLSILVLHFLAFKIVTFIYILISNKDMLYLAAFPVIRNVPFLWLFYTVCGVSVSLFAEYVFFICKKALLKNIKSK